MKEKPGILLVDDEVEISSALQRDLRKYAREEGRPVFAVHSGKDALAFLEKDYSRIGIIVSDQKMPEMTGGELLKKTAVLYPDIMTIILTGHADTKDIGSFVEAGIFAFLEKPWKRAHLIMEIKKAFTIYDIRIKNKICQERFNQEIQLAEQFNKTLLDVAIPETSAFSFDVKKMNAREFTFGGDYFDIISLGDKQYLMLMGDVSGHGLKASFMVAIIKSFIYGELKDWEGDSRISPSYILAWLNKKINTFIGRMPHLFVSFSALLLDGNTGKGTYSNAGQPPIYLIRGDDCRAVIQEHLPLGIDANVAFVEDTFEIKKDDLIVMFTDGVYPSGVNVSGFSVDQFEKIILSSLRKGRFVESFSQAVHNFLGEEFLKDDVTVAAVGVLE